MYYVSYNDGVDWDASRCVTLYKVKETVVKGASEPIYIGERHSMNDDIKPILFGVKKNSRYMWTHIVRNIKPINRVR